MAEQANWPGQEVTAPIQGPGAVPPAQPAATAPPRLIPITSPQSTIPQGYQQTPNGLAPIPGGPADQAHQAPSGYRYAAGGNLEPIPGGPADPDRITRGPSGNSSLSGPDYVASIPDPARRATVQAMIDGRIPYPRAQALRDPHWQQAVADALQADPQYDAANATTRVTTRQDFTSGQSSRNISSINTAIGHLASLQQAADALDNGNWQAINTVRNWWRETSGDPRLTAFNERRQAVVDELEKAFRGSSGTQTGIEEWRASINAAQSPQQLHEAIRSGIDLLNSRLSALGDTYNRGLGRSEDPMTFLSPHSRELLAHLQAGPAAQATGGSGDGLPGTPPPDSPAGPAVTVGGGHTPPAGQVLVGYMANGDGSFHSVYGVPGTHPGNGLLPPDRVPGPLTDDLGRGGLEVDINGGRGDARTGPAAEIPAYLSRIASTGIGSAERYQALQQLHAALGSQQLQYQGDGDTAVNQFGITRSQTEALDAEFQDADRARHNAADLDRVGGREGYIDRITHGMTLGLDDEAAGVGTMLLHPTTPLQSFRMGRDAQRIRLDEARQDTGGLGTVAELGGSLLTLGPGFEAGGINGIRNGTNTVRAAGFGAARDALASGATREEALAAARTAAIRRMTADGTAISALQGGADANGDMADRAAHAATAAALAFGGGRLAGRLMGRATTGAAPAAADAEQIAAAQSASELGIDLPRFIAGGESAQRTGNRLEQTAAGGPVISGARRTVVEQGEAARDAEAANLGTAVEPEAAGEAAVRGATAWRQGTSAEGRRLYGAATAAAGDATVTPQTTMQTLAQLLRTEREVPGGTDALPILQHYADAFDAGGQISIDAARKMRTQLRSRLGETMSPDNADRITNQIMGAVGQDIETSLRAAGREGAIPAYRAADRFWADRMGTINDVLRPIVGKDGQNWGADAVRAIQNDVKGNPARLAAFLNTIPENEANTIRATLIRRLGRATSGGQNAEGDAFSLDTFLTNWDQIKGSRDQIFPAETVTQLNHLAVVANRVKAAARTANRSNTGSIVSAALTGSPAMTGVMASLASGDVKMAAVGVLGTLGLALRQYGSARLLASAAFARRLATTPMNPQAAQAFWSRPWVANLARSNPAIGADVLGVQESIIHTLEHSQRGGSNSQRQNR